MRHRRLTINQRLKSIEIRKDLTDQWKEHGVEEGTGYATLTDIIYQTWAGLTAREYKHLKGLRKENLRNNMTNEELVMKRNTPSPWTSTHKPPIQTCLWNIGNRLSAARSLCEQLGGISIT